MNKFHQTKMIPAVAVITVFIIGLISCKKKEANDVQGAILTAISGTVTLTKGEVRNTISPDQLYSKEAIFSNGMILETGKDSKVDLQFQTGTQLRVGPSSKIKLENASILSGENFSQTLIRIDSGSLYAKVNKLEKGSSMALVTPTAIASVRGTDFLTKVEQGQSTVLVEDGAVAVSDDQSTQEEVVEGGNKAKVEGNDVNVAPLDEDDKKELQEYGSNIQGITEQGRQQIESIMQTFEDQKAEILKAIEDQKAANRELIEGQIESNRQLIEGQLESNRKLIQEQTERDLQNKEEIENKSKENVQQNIDQGRQGIQDQTKQSPLQNQNNTQSELDKIRNQGVGQ
ncbi:MAG: FecR domain-containing protein [Leptonema sp. (in: Bacteria)]|nr:FecR domain-containing protein [Leptonema sp. (in: bacteria)]